MTTTRVDIGAKRVHWTGGSFGSGTGQSFTRTSTDVKSGSTSRNWRQRIRLHQNATNGYSRSGTDDGHVRGFASFRQINPVDVNEVLYCYADGALLESNGPGPPALPLPGNVDTQARVNFLQKARKARRSFQGGVFLGELREAIHMITRPASALRRAVSSYSSAANKAVRRARNAKAKARALSGTWLEYSYGWRPLFSDVDDGMKALAGTPRVVGEKLTGFAKEQSKSAPYLKSRGISSNASTTCRFVDESIVLAYYAGEVGYENDNSAPDWKSNWGLTLSDFLPTVWELIPYSFLVDYFSNVGQVLDSASMGVVSLRWGSRSILRVGKTSLVASEITWAGTNNVKFTPLSISVSAPNLARWDFSRAKVDSVSVFFNDVSLRIPGIDDWHKWANIGALALEKFVR